MQIYEDDPRYEVDQNEKLRLDLDNLDVGKFCNQHGLGNDAEREKRKRVFNKTNDFY
jgi:predicted ATP-dependent Lon-type protease